MFQFPGLAAQSLCIQPCANAYDRIRLPDSEISGSTLVRSYPELFAAIHVLLRLSTPRHPPCALSSLTVPLRYVSSSYASLELRTTRTSFQASNWTIHYWNYAHVLLESPHGVLVLSIQLSRNRRTLSRGLEICGADRDRTDDLRLAKPALSQLSYSPI